MLFYTFPALHQDNTKKLFHLNRKWEVQQFAISIHVAKVPMEAELPDVLKERRSIFTSTSLLQVCQQLIVEGRGWRQPSQTRRRRFWCKEAVDEGTRFSSGLLGRPFSSALSMLDDWRYSIAKRTDMHFVALH